MSTKTLQVAALLLAAFIGQTASADAPLYVNNQLEVADFEDLDLAPDSDWRGNTSDPEYTCGRFFSGSCAFTNYYNPEWASWAGFGYSSRTGSEFTSFSDDMVCAAGSGHDSDRYGVAFMSDYYGPVTLSLADSAEPQTIPGLWLTNTQWVKEAVLYGDGMSEAFGPGDYCAVRICGLLPDGTSTEPLEIPLADYRADDDAEWYVLDTWQWHSLESLGAVSGLRWEFTSSKRNAYGITTPAYSCLDDLGASCHWERLDPVILSDIERTLPLAPLFAFPEDDPVSYTLHEGEAEISGNALTITAPELTSTILRLSAESRGRRRWIELPVEVTQSGIEAIDSGSTLRIEVFDLTGLCLHSGTEMPRLPSGIYLVVRHTPAGTLRRLERL